MRKKGRKPSFPSPFPLFHFLVLVSFLARSKPKIPFHGHFLPRNQTQNACYAGYQSLGTSYRDWLYWIIKVLGYLTGGPSCVKISELDAAVPRYWRPLKIRDFVWEIKYWDLRNLIPRVLSYPPYGAGRREPWEGGWDLRNLNNVKSNFSFVLWRG